MNDCVLSVPPLWYDGNYNWGFRQASNRLNYGIAVFVNEQLYCPIIDKLGFTINNIES
jgi:hypothetical protein